MNGATEIRTAIPIIPLLPQKGNRQCLLLEFLQSKANPSLFDLGDEKMYTGICRLEQMLS